MEKLQGKKILVVGATGGIGSNLVKLLHQSGASVFVSGRNLEKLSSLTESIGIEQTKSFQCDISVQKEVEELEVTWL